MSDNRRITQTRFMAAEYGLIREGRVVKASREFQIFAKPAGAACNLDCSYCYYLHKDLLYPEGESFRMPDDLLEEYIRQQIAITPEPAINFFWHGGEPTVLGIDYFRKITGLQRKHLPPGRRIDNGIQTNGVLLDDDWCRFLAAERFQRWLEPRRSSRRCTTSIARPGTGSPRTGRRCRAIGSAQTQDPGRSFVRRACRERPASPRGVPLLQGDQSPIHQLLSRLWSRSRLPGRREPAHRAG